MMPQSAPTTPVCRDCDGFATASITTGLRTAAGARDIVRVDCPACHGLGHAAPASAVIRIGR
ncbi:hypothetical protein [Streptomyces sp. NPDC029003]|uniref:hypothetical protein n=1 Tax=Streptomyces sp. NPDC029003 TaxID=3155125 RepID=UPI0033CFECE1